MMVPYLDDAVKLLRMMVKTPSLSFEEENVQAVISKQLDEWGVKHQLFKRNIVAIAPDYDPRKKTLALDAHIDTVPANSGYTRDPLSPGDEEDIIWGLGSNDDGGSVVSMTSAFRHLCGSQLPVNLMLVLSCEEERSGPDGARWLYSGEGPFGHELPMPDFVIVGEPTGMKAATSERGLLVLDGEAHGVSGHAARNEGVNALYIAMEDIEKLRNHVFSKVSPIMGNVKLTVTQIQAGTAHNVIPDSCKFVVDIRPTEQYTNEEILSDLQKECSSTLVARNLTNRSSASSPESELYKTVERLGIEMYSSPTTSDWMRISADALKMGPGESSRSHRPDEFIKKEEIADAINKYIEFIENIYGDTVE